MTTLSQFPLVRRWLPWLLLGLGTLAALRQTLAVAAPAIPLMERQKEIALALSACPTSIAEKAAVYVLESSGYVKVRESQNGFTALVQHSLLTSQEPQCMDAEGARTLLQRMLRVAELRAQGKSADEIKRIIADLLARGELQPPRRPGIDYMLSTENLVPDEKGVVAHFPAHVMFFGTHLRNADLGSGGQGSGSPLFVAGEDSPFALIIVPVGLHEELP